MLRDLIIVIPGIMGSVLARRDDGGQETLWNPGPGLVGKLFRHRQWVESLRLQDDDRPDDPGWLDDIVPIGLVESRTIVPGLVRIDGYSELHETLRRTFGTELVEGDALDPQARVDGGDPVRDGVPNYYRFAYDWRRDLRASALRLHNLIEEALPRLREQRSPQANIIFVTHSMGGLLARYYLEGVNPQTGDDFDGWRNTRELLSFGTPYRGSIDATEHLTHGFKKLFVDFTESLRSYTGVYQLLPRYRAVQDADGQWRYPYEVTVDGLDRGRAKTAYEDFHVAIEHGVQRHTQDPDYDTGYVIPMIGYGHNTKNSAFINADGELTVSQDLPEGVPAALSGGDGTVPLVSALPLDYAEAGDAHSSIRYANQEHGSIQVDRRVMATEIETRLRYAQSGTSAVRGDDQLGDPSGQPHLTVELSRLWLAGAGTDVHGNPAGTAKLGLTNAEGNIQVTVTKIGQTEPVAQTTAQSGHEVSLPGDPGEYVVSARGPKGTQTTSGYAVLDAETG